MKIMLYNRAMLVNILIGLTGILIFLFIFWKRLKEDYAAGIIFKTGFWILLGIGMGWILSFKFLNNWSFYLQMVGGLGSLGILVWRSRMKFYETFEASVIGILPWLAFSFMADSASHSSLSSFLGFLVILILILAFYLLDNHYREFSWYKSGKIGFSGLATLTLFFIIRSVLATMGITVLSFTGKYEAIVSGSLAFICLTTLFNLGRKST